MPHSLSVTVQLAIREAREAGLFDAPIRSTQVLDDAGLRLVFHLANGRAVPWPPTADLPSAPTAAADPLPPLPDPDDGATTAPPPAPPPPEARRRRK